MNEKQCDSSFEKLVHCMLDLLSHSSNISDALNSDILMKFVYEETKKAFEEKKGILDEIERDRLNEAFKSYSQDLYYFSAIMSGSAVEYRLFSLISERYEKKKAELTMGQVIREYTQNKEKYGSLIPEEHEPLLNYFTTHRVFSVFPEKENGEKPFATLTLCIACYFIFDNL